MTDTTHRTLGQISYEAQQAYYTKTFPNWRIEQWASLSSHKRNSEEDGAEAIAAPLLARVAELTKELALLQSQCPTCSWKTPGSLPCSTENCIHAEKEQWQP